ncbi:MAG: hypothetical protein WAZ21_04430 [Candidatus Saccharimonadales bacterium]
MTITTLTTQDVTITLTDGPAHMLAVYSRTLEEMPDQEGSRHYDMSRSPSGPGITVEADSISYGAVGVILPRATFSDTAELALIVIIKTSQLPDHHSHMIFTCYTQYSEWAVKMDLLQIEDDDEGTLDDFLDLSIKDKWRLLGLI